MSQLIWYTSYGSNLRRKRFLVYILGGIAPGGKQAQSGCRDRTLPAKEAAVELPNSLYFSGHSFVYDGAVGFITPQPGDRPTKARAYLVTLEQFWEITRQENNWQELPKAPKLEELKREGSILLDDMGGSFSQYRRVVYCGEREGYPVLSFTTPEAHKEAKPPSPLYIQTMAIGLAEAHAIDNQAIAEYLIDVPGIAGNFQYNELLEMLHNNE